MVKDALLAAPNLYKKLFENEQVRVLEVTIKPGQKEPMHTHQYKGVVVVLSPSKLRFYDENDEVDFETETKGVEWREPAGAHAAENIGKSPFIAYRIELKK